MGGSLFAALAILIMLGFINWIFHIPFFATLISAFGAFLFSVYIIYDVQVRAPCTLATLLHATSMLTLRSRYCFTFCSC